MTARPQPGPAFPAPPRRRTVRRLRRCRQHSLFCACGRNLPSIAGFCASCYWRLRNSKRRFGGQRDRVLERDGFACRVCGAAGRVVVHHRRRGHNDRAALVSLCPACHARLHHTRAMRKWMPQALVPLWAEQHPDTAVQLQLELPEGTGE